jgi:HAD superfamily hydrolase (TIGR01509 family)
MVRAVLFDVDGTLVDSNDAHARAWVDAFAEAGVQVSYDDVRRAIGMGGDKLMPAVAGVSEDSPEGARISKRRPVIFKERYLPRIRPLPGASDLARTLKARGDTLVAASSAKQEELTALLRIAGVERLLDAATSGDDAEESKPDPDIVHAALERAGARPDEAVMIGDTPYDVKAARTAGVRVIALRSGGWTDEDLHGAEAVYDHPADLLAHLTDSPLARG